MLKQEIGWFDQWNHSTGILTSRLATDAAYVKGVSITARYHGDCDIPLHIHTHTPPQATGIRLGTLLQTIFSFVAAIVIAFEASPQLAPLMILTFPIIGSVIYIQTRLLAGRTQKNKKRLESSGQIAVESIDSIRTVTSLAMEENFYNRYRDLLAGPFRYTPHTSCTASSFRSLMTAGTTSRVCLHRLWCSVSLAHSPFTCSQQASMSGLSWWWGTWPSMKTFSSS